MIPKELRREYVGLLTEYDLAVGQARVGRPLLPEPERLEGFRRFCERAWAASRELVDAARAVQTKRSNEKVFYENCGQEHGDAEWDR